MTNGWDAMAASAGSILSGYFGVKQNKKAAQKQFEYAAALQAMQQKWLTEMSNTAHQREVKDLREAGLNPLLSINSGASTPNSGMGSVGLLNNGETMANAASQAMNAYQIKNKVKNENALTKSQIQLNKSIATHHDTSAAESLYKAENIQSLTKTENEMRNDKISYLKEQIKNIKENTGLTQKQKNNYEYKINSDIRNEYLKAEAAIRSAKAANATAAANLQNAATTEKRLPAQNAKDYHESKTGKAGIKTGPISVNYSGEMIGQGNTKTKSKTKYIYKKTYETKNGKKYPVWIRTKI